MPANKAIKKTTIELTQAQYIFLKEKVLELQKQNKSASVVSIIRGFIDQAMRKDKKV